MNPPPDRPRYTPSGNLEPVPLLLMTGGLAGFALLVGYVVHAGSNLTFPGVVLGPFLAGLPVAGFVTVAVAVGRCRNPSVGAMLGVFAGLLVVVGAFQFAMAAEKGDDHFFRLDLLPAWLDEHVNDGVLWGRAGVRAGRPAVPPRDADLAFRWGVIAVGCLAATVFPAAAGYLTAGAPFAEEHGRWLKAWTARLTRDSGQVVADVLASGSAEQLRGTLVPIPPGEKVDPAVGFALLTVEYLPGEAAAPVYASVGIMIPTGKKQTVTPKWLVNRWELTPAEAAAVADALPVPDAAFRTAKPGTRPGERASTLLAARVLPLPDQDVRQILSPRAVKVATAIGLAPLALGLGLAGAAGGVAGACWDDLEPVEAAAVIAGGVLSLLAALAWIVLYADWLPSRYYLARARRVIADRPDPIVRPDDPDAIFVQVVPRKNWGRIMMENADDVGLLLLDSARGVLLYEGDRERWLIPRESVVSYELEAFDVGPTDPNAGPAFWLVVLRANVGGEVWEAPIAPRPVHFHKHTPASRREQAEELRDRIVAALDL